MATLTLSITETTETPAAVQIVSFTDPTSGADIAASVGLTLPAALTLSGGEWSIGFTDTGLPLYAYTYTFTWADGSTSQPVPGTKRGSVPAGTHYSSRAAIEAAAGIVNVAVIADLQNGGDATYVATRIEAALSESDSIIDARLAQQNQAVPTSGPYQKRLATIGAYYALVYLYRPRGIADANLKGYLIAWQTAADTELDAIAWALNRDALCAGAAPQLAYHDPCIGQTARASLGIPVW